jgi:hypothetical protein
MSTMTHPMLAPHTITAAIDAPEAGQVEAPATAPFAGGAAGFPRLVLRAEGALAFVAALLVYRHLDGSWAMFLALFLVPDLSMLGYLVGRRAGAIAYDAAHTYLTAGALAIGGVVFPALLPLAAIWAAHVGFDRMLGYGLKYASGFTDTHLGRVGRSASGRSGG